MYSGEYHETGNQHQGDEECDCREQCLRYPSKTKGFQDRYELDLPVVPHRLTAGLVEGYRALSPRSKDTSVDGSDPGVHIPSFGAGRREVSNPRCVMAGFEGVTLRCVRLQLKIERVLHRETGHCKV